MATGRDVLTVARESYALTLYTHWHLEQRRRLDAIARKSERFDLAGLMASAYHEPKKLGEHYRDFLDTLRPLHAPSAETPSTLTARQLAVVRAMHASNPTVQPLAVS